MVKFGTDSDSESEYRNIEDDDDEERYENDSEVSLPAYREQLLETLSIKKISNFAYGESLHEFCLPHLNVLDIGLLNLPLHEYDVKTIVARCAQAPFGRGEETIIDTTVRNTWELSPTEFTIENRDLWEAFVDKLAEKARFELGFTNAIIEKRLYKLLLYEEGGFFQPHRDSEKETGMFASLVIVLPSNYKGGQLVIQHNGNEKEFDFGGLESGNTINYIAFYTDCEHEVRTITQGHRLCLVYNIINSGQDPVPLPFDDDATLIKQITDNFRQWESDPNGPIKFVYLLEHEYTSVSLSFRNLKGRDRAVTQLMKQVQSYTGAVMVLANLKWKCEVNLHDDYDENDYKLNFGKMTMAPIINIDNGIFDNEALGIFIEDQVLNWKLFNTRRPHSTRPRPTGNDGVEVKCQYQATGLVFCLNKNSSIMKFDLMGAELSIANIVKITQAEEAYEQGQALLRSAALRPIVRWRGFFYFTKDDPIKNGALLVKLLAFFRQFRLVNLYLDLLRQNVLCVSSVSYRYSIYQSNDPNLSSEVIRGCSELGWVELAPTIKQYVEQYFKSQAGAITHSLVFSKIPENSQEKQIRSDLLDNLLMRTKDWRHYTENRSWMLFIETFHYLGDHSLIADNIQRLDLQNRPISELMNILPIIETIIATCQSCDSFKELIKPHLVSLIKNIMAIFNMHVSRLRPAAQCKCKDCGKAEEFLHNPTAIKEQFTVDCNIWEENIYGCARVKEVKKAEEQEEDPVIKKKKLLQRTIVLTKGPSAIKKIEKSLQAIDYLQSLTL